MMLSCVEQEKNFITWGPAVRHSTLVLCLTADQVTFLPFPYRCYLFLWKLNCNIGMDIVSGEATLPFSAFSHYSRGVSSGRKRSCYPMNKFSH